MINQDEELAATIGEQRADAILGRCPESCIKLADSPCFAAAIEPLSDQKSSEVNESCFGENVLDIVSIALELAVVVEEATAEPAGVVLALDNDLRVRRFTHPSWQADRRSADSPASIIQKYRIVPPNECGLGHLQIVQISRNVQLSCHLHNVSFHLEVGRPAEAVLQLGRIQGIQNSAADSR